MTIEIIQAIVYNNYRYSDVKNMKRLYAISIFKALLEQEGGE